MYSFPVQTISEPFPLVSNDDEPEPRWVLFNDFAVREVPEEEALDFDPDWKVRDMLFLRYMADTDLRADAGDYHARAHQ